MALESILNFISNNLSLNEAISVGKPLTLFIIGMVIYSFFIFKFYRFVAKRDIFYLNLAAYSNSKWETLEDIIASLLYILEHLIIFPLFSFFWFLILSLFLIFLSRDLPVTTLLTSAMAVVATIRISSYYKEELAVDIAKTLPLTLLGIFLINGLSTFSLDKAIEAIIILPQIWKTILYYLLYIVLIELTLRILLFTYNIFKYRNKK